MKSIHYPHSTTTAEEAKALESRFEKVLLADVKNAFVSANLGLTPISIQKPDSYGTRHVIYIVTVAESSETYIFRSNIGYTANPEVVLLREKLMTELARNAGVPVNEILYADCSRLHVPFDFQIQRQVKGLDLEDHFSGSEEDYRKLSMQLGQMTAKLHTIPLEGFGRFDHKSTDVELIGDISTNYDYIMLDLEKETKLLNQVGIISEKQVSKIINFFESSRAVINIEKGVLVHYDIADHNIMHEATKITGLIDWEAAVSSDPVLDIASMPTWKTHYPRLEEFLEGYQMVSKLPENFDLKMTIYKLRTILWKTVFCYNAGILNETRKRRLYDCLVESNV